MYSSRLRMLFLVIFFAPLSVSAQTLNALMMTITGWITQLIPLLLSLAVLMFFWGLVKFMRVADDEKSHEEGKNIMIWGMIALFVMVAFWALIGFLQNSIGIGGVGPTATAPNTPITIPA